ncbi:SCY1 family protein kinase [Cavenderia fasciculata]|uniref:SCY1 family protein kinase n=1 Tax=Cavenderia fasciculata TaxID=261658 RepID=F4Q8Y1_CACFS|nr:SCY1 family protein kinase [Cavenderia fasciculata]EGG15150.1 SCY1 family protein kinase [Cavenderia fasciculata]|eukprot:XP_004351870.1 SCY1 family protein kinase [Cavenderia fasciculata]
MNFLNLLIGQGTAQFPFNIGQAVTSYTGKSIWTLHQGTKKDDGSVVSIFSFDVKKNPSKLEVARNGFKRAKTIRHPNFITYIDGLETDSNIYIVTETITPLDEAIQDIKKFDDAISWGIYQITNGLSFLSGKNLTHGNLCMTTIFVNKSGDWKLGGLDLVCDVRDANPLLKTHVDLVPAKYRAPEVSKAQWSQINTAPSFAIDAWMLGCLMYECYSGVMSKSEDVRELASIPKSLQPSYQKCFSSKPEQRLNPQKFLESSYFSNIFVETCTFLENITLKDQFEKETFFKKLDQHLDKLPTNICKFKILPHLITAFEIGPINTKILGTLLKISSNLSTEEYTTKVVPSVVKWFAMDDRGLRVNLLENLEHYIQHLSSTVINDQIFPNVVNGFNDKPALKELTIKSMLLFAPKLSEKTMLQLLKYFAALQKDMEPGIRTNTTVCLGRISEHISPDTRKRVLVPAFSTSLRDPFVPSQNAGLSAFMFTQQYYTPDEIATKVIPEISRMLISPEKQIRTTAFQAMSLFIGKLETFSSQLPDTQQQQQGGSQQGGQQGSGSGSNQGGHQTMGPDGQETMLGWAYGLTKKYIATATNESPLASPPPLNSSNNSYSSSNSSSSNTPSSNFTSPQQSKQSEKEKEKQKTTSYSTSSSSSTTTKKNNINADGWDENDDDLFDDDEPVVETKKSIPSKVINNNNNNNNNNDNSSGNKTGGGGMKLSSKPKNTFSYQDDDSDNNNNKSSGDWNDWDDSNNNTVSSRNSSSSSTKKKTTTIVKSKPTSTDGWDDWND